MAVTLKQSTLEAYIQDPVLAAWAIFGANLDIFQQGRLRTMWFTPEVIDDSGISTGKTEILWIWAQLRCILLPQPAPYPHRIVGIYYPTLESAKSNFMPKYEKYIETSPTFRNELRSMHGGTFPQAQPILTPFARGAVELAPVWGEDRFRNSDEGIIEAIHRVAQAMFASGSILWPAPQEDRPATEFAAFDAEQRMALLALTITLQQFLSIKVVVGPDLAPRVTKRGFLMFRAEGKRKKDLAYAALYSLAGLLSLLMDPEFHEDEEEPGSFMAVG